MRADPMLTFELDMLQQRLRKPLQAHGFMVAEGISPFSDAHAELVSKHALPLLRDYPDLDLLAIEDEIADALADAAAAHDLAQANEVRAVTPKLHRACAPARAYTALPAYYAAITEPAVDALTRQRDTIRQTIADGARVAGARRELGRRRERELPYLDNPTPARKAALTRRLHCQVADDWNFKGGRIPAAPRMLVSGAQGTGKTRTTLHAVADIRERIAVRFTEPTVEKAAEAAADYAAIAGPRSLPYTVVRGRSQQDPTAAPDTAMCPRYEIAERVAARGLSVRTTMCSTCPLAASCGSLRQAAAIEAMQGVGVFFMATAGLFVTSPAPAADLLVIDERIDPTDVIRVPLDVLAAGTLPYPGGDNLAAYMQAHAVLEGLRDALSRPDQLAALHEEGITMKLLVELMRLLRPLAEPTPLPTGLTDKEIKAALDAMPDRAAAADALAVLRAVLREIDQPRSVLNGITQPDKDGEVAVCRLKRMLGTAHAGVLALDGTGDAALNRAMLGDQLQHVEARIERDAHTTSPIGKSYSRQSLTGLDAFGRVMKGKGKQDSAKRLRDEIATVVARQPGPCLVIAAQSAELALRDHLPPDTPTTHFGELRGRNTWTTCASVVAVGPAPIALDTLEELARCYMADDPEPFVSSVGAAWPEDHEYRDRGWPFWCTRMRRMRDGSLQPVEVPVHPNPRVQDVLEQVREAELVQGVDRTRAIFNRRTFTLLNSLVLDLTYDACPSHRDLVEGGSRWERAIAATGILPLGARDLHHIHPSLFSTETAARRALENTPTAQIGVLFEGRGYLIAYRRAGQRGRLSRAWIDPKLHSDPHATLTAALGPLAWFEVLQAPPAVVEAMQAAEKPARRRNPSPIVPPGPKRHSAQTDHPQPHHGPWLPPMSIRPPPDIPTTVRLLP